MSGFTLTISIFGTDLTTTLSKIPSIPSSSPSKFTNTYDCYICRGVASAPTQDLDERDRSDIDRLGERSRYQLCSDHQFTKTHGHHNLDLGPGIRPEKDQAPVIKPQYRCDPYDLFFDATRLVTPGLPGHLIAGPGWFVQMPEAAEEHREALVELIGRAYREPSIGADVPWDTFAKEPLSGPHSAVSYVEENLAEDCFETAWQKWIPSRHILGPTWTYGNSIVLEHLEETSMIDLPHTDHWCYQRAMSTSYAYWLEIEEDDCILDELELLGSRRIVRTAGHFSIHPPSPLARELSVVTGKLLCFVEDDKKDIRMIVLEPGHRLITKPNTSLTIYSIEPSITFSRHFSTWRWMLDVTWTTVGIEAVLLAMWIHDPAQEEKYDETLDADLLNLLNDLVARTSHGHGRYHLVFRRLCGATDDILDKESGEGCPRDIETERDAAQKEQSVQRA